MAHFFRKPDRRQQFLLPVDMMDWLAEDDIVHLVVDAVELMDLSGFEAASKVGRAGQPPFAPAMLLALLIYAYSHGVRSSRAIERLCRRDAGYRFIVGHEVPDHTVIARFRQRHAGRMKSVFLQVLELCREAGLIRLGLVALDGTKVKANASLDANRTAATIEAQITRILAEAATTDAREDREAEAESRGSTMPEDLARHGARLARLKICQDKLNAKARADAARQQEKIAAREGEEKATGKRRRGRKPRKPDPTVDPDTVANPTDPDSGIMKTRRGWVQGYNAQAVVTPCQIILAADVTDEANDVNQLTVMLDQAQVNVEAVTGESAALGAAVADAGYWSQANAARESEECELFIAIRKGRDQRAALRDAPSPRGRMPETTTPRERMERKLRTKRGQAIYRQRGAAVEPVFGQMKDRQGADRFSVRGLERCRGEWQLDAAVHNLRKLHRDSVKNTKTREKSKKAGQKLPDTGLKSPFRRIISAKAANHARNSMHSATGSRVDNLKVLHIITELGDGGAEGVLYRLCRQDCQNTHIVVSLMDAGKYGPLLADAGIQVVSIGMPRGRLTPRGLWQLLRHIRAIRPDIVQTWMYHADLLGGILARMAGYRRVFWGIRHTRLVPGQSARATVWVARICARLSRFVPERIICCAQAARQVHAAMGYDATRMLVVPNGYDTARFSPDPGAGQQLRAELSIPNDVPVIGYVARYNPQKDHETLLSALVLLKQQGQCPYCFLVGTGVDENNTSLTERIAALGLSPFIYLLGRRNDIPAIMNAIDIHVMSSSFGEAFPNVLAEAMACGTPCVATDIGDAAAILGETGRIVPPCDATGLAEGIAAFLVERRQEADWDARCQAARDHIAGAFSMEAMLAGFNAAWSSRTPP